MKRGSTSLIIREMQIKASHLLEWPWWVSTKWQEMASADKDMEKGEPLCIIGRNIKWYRHNGKKSTEVPWEIKNRILSYDPAISFLCIFPKKVKALAWTWIQLPWSLKHNSQDLSVTYVSTGEWRNGEGWCMYKGILLSHRKEMLPCMTTWMTWGDYAKWD